MNTNHLSFLRCPRPFVFVLPLVLSIAGIAGSRAQGPLDPPRGLPAPNMKTLQQVEPRTPVEALPFSITEAGSYYLTGNLVAPERFAGDGITIDASGVTLDLMGFNVQGILGSKDGISVSTDSEDVVIHNGHIRGWGAHGIDAESVEGCQFRNLTVSRNTLSGIQGGTECVIQSCTALENGGAGFFANRDGAIENCSALRNGGVGISGIAGAIRGCNSNFNLGDGFFVAGGVISECTALQNVGNGIVAGQATNPPLANRGAVVTSCVANDNDLNGIVLNINSVCRDCTANGNTSNGISSSDGTSVSGCVARQNAVDGIVVTDNCTVRDCVATENTGDGIEAGSRGRLRDNEVVENSGAGLRVTGSSTRIEDNQLLENGTGIAIAGSGCAVSENTVRGNGSNYSFAAGNRLELVLCDLPLTISWPAHIRLAGTLAATSAIDAITVASENVSIDLGGHALIGEGQNLMSDGIVINIGISGTVIRNGTLRDWGGNGINANTALDSHFSDLVVKGNGLDGIRGGSGSVVRNCSGLNNGEDGFHVGADSQVVDCAARQNTVVGIRAGSDCTVEDCLSNGNTADGIVTSNDCTIRDCVANANGTDGIDPASDCRIVGNSCNDNGNAVAGRAGIRIDGSDCLVRDNTVEGNPSGFYINNNDNLVIGNLAAKNDINFDLVGAGAVGTDYGEILIEPGAAFVSTNPFANFEQR